MDAGIRVTSIRLYAEATIGWRRSSLSPAQRTARPRSAGRPPAVQARPARSTLGSLDLYLYICRWAYGGSRRSLFRLSRTSDGRLFRTSIFQSPDGGRVV